MNKVPYTNDGPNTVHIGPVAVRSGDTRMVDPRDVPGYRKPGAPAEPAPDAVAALMAGKAAEIIAAVPALSADDLARAKAIEEAASKPRVTVLEAITARQIELAEQTGEGGEGDKTGEGGEGGESGKIGDGGDQGTES